MGVEAAKWGCDGGLAGAEAGQWHADNYILVPLEAMQITKALEQLNRI